MKRGRQMANSVDSPQATGGIVKALVTGKPQGKIGLSSARRLSQDALALANRDGRAGQKLRNALRIIERRHEFTPGARAVFQDCLARLGGEVGAADCWRTCCRAAFLARSA